MLFQSPAAASTTFVSSISHDNSNDGFIASGASGTATTSSTALFVNDLAFANGRAGFFIDSGAVSQLYHVVAHHNADSSSFGGNFMLQSNGGHVSEMTLANSVGYRPWAGANVYAYNPDQTAVLIHSDHNLFVPRSSNGEVFAEVPLGTAWTYRNPPPWVGASDLAGVAAEPGFQSIDATDLALNDYHLRADGGPAYHSGTALPSVPFAELDLSGAPRSARPDIGLYEFDAPLQPSSSDPLTLRVICSCGSAGELAAPVLLALASLRSRRRRVRT